MELIDKLEQAGFIVTLNGEKIRLEYTGPGEPPKGGVKVLLAALRDHRAEVVAYLKSTMPKPFLDPSGSLKIPFGGNRCYFWWAGGQSTEKTVEEIKRGLLN